MRPEPFQDDGTLGSLLRASRVRLSHTLPNLAHKAGLSPGYLSKLENNLAVPRESTFTQLVQILQLDEAEVASRARTLKAQRREARQHRADVVSTGLPPDLVTRADRTGAAGQRSAVAYAALSEPEFLETIPSHPNPIIDAVQQTAIAHLVHGHHCCDRNQVERGLAYYEAAASFAIAVSLGELAVVALYRVIRTCQNLVEFNLVEDKLGYIGRALERIEHVYELAAATVPSAISPVSVYAASVMNVAASLHADLFAQLNQIGSAPQPDRFTSGLLPLVELRRSYRTRAHQASTSLIAALKAERRTTSSPERKRLLGHLLPEAYLYHALIIRNWLREDSSPRPDMHDLERHFLRAMRIQCAFGQRLTDPDERRAAHRRLVRMHEALARTYEYDTADRLLERYWQHQLSQRLLPGARRHVYVPGDTYPDTVADFEPLEENKPLVTAINEEIEVLATTGAIAEMRYPLIYRHSATYRRFAATR